MDSSVLLYIKIIIDFVLKLLSYFKSSDDVEKDEFPSKDNSLKG